MSSGGRLSSGAEDFRLLREYRSRHTALVQETQDKHRLEQLAERYRSLERRFTANSLWASAAMCNALTSEVYEKIGALELQCRELLSASRNLNKPEWDVLGTNLDLDHSKVNTDTILRKASSAYFDHGLSLVAGSICSSACDYRRDSLRDEEGAGLLCEHLIEKALESNNCRFSKCCFLKKAVCANIEQKQYVKAWEYVRRMRETIDAEFGEGTQIFLAEWALITAILLEILLFRASVDEEGNCAALHSLEEGKLQIPLRFKIIATDLIENLKDPKANIDKLSAAMLDYLDDTQSILLTAIGELREENFSDLLVEAAMAKPQDT